MDFKLTDEQIERRKEFFEACKKLEKQKPANFVGHESIYTSDEGWEYHLHCAKEFAKRGFRKPTRRTKKLSRFLDFYNTHGLTQLRAG